jgi:cellulose synthase/poly-beta-1,6-N-acetylglucosamine synthase-like glycosyltransferase
MGPELLALSAMTGVLAIHPFTTYPVSLALLARAAARPARAPHPISPRASVALCVCAYNEERIIRAKAENMLALQRATPGLELLVYVDAATDRTAEILHQYAGRIRTIVAPQRRGKTYGMNTLVAATDAEFVVFSDANVMFAPDAITCLLRPFADPDVGCVCGHLVYHAAEGSTTAETGSVYWRLEEKIKELESRTGSTMGADGSIFAIRRTLHHPPPPDIIDDMFVSLSILCDGHRVVRAADALAYEETVSRPREEFRRKIRIACQAFNVHRLLRPRLRRLSLVNRYKYASHKLLRWMSGYLLAVAGLLFLAGLIDMAAWRALAATIVLVLGTLAIALARPASVPGKLLDIAGAFLATSFGIIRSIRGERFQTWTPPASARSGG